MVSVWNPVDMIREDGQILVVRKPAGLAVQNRKASQMDLEHILMNYLAEKEGKGSPRLHVIHRLDQPVEGLLVFAKTEEAAAVLSRQIQMHQIVKEYLAVADGVPEQTEGRLTDWLLKNGRTNTSRVVSPGEKGAKKAVLDYRCLERLPGGRALLQIELLTGRHHQIRVQLSHAGMPLLGDSKYHPGQGNKKNGQLALCAFRLTFFHPATGEKICCQTEPRGEWFRSVGRFS